MAVQTLCIVGFPQNASRREIQNLCRLMPGFVDMNIAKSTLFAKFSSGRVASETAKELDGFQFDVDDPDSVLKATLARRDLRSERDEADSRYDPPRNDHRPGKRAAPIRIEDLDHRDRDAKRARRDEIDTIVVSVDRSDEYTKDEVREWLEDRRGFVQLQMSRMTNLAFVKFSSSRAANRALDDAADKGIHAELARRNLELFDDVARAGPVGGGGVPVSRHRDHREEPDPRSRRSSGHEIDTIVAFGVYGGSVDRNKVEDFFARESGYLRLQHQENIGGMFIKFETGHAAQRALDNFKNTAGEPEVKVELARRSLN